MQFRKELLHTEVIITLGNVGVKTNRTMAFSKRITHCFNRVTVLRAITIVRALRFYASVRLAIMGLYSESFSRLP